MDFNKIASKWQQKWAQEKVFKTDINPKKEKFSVIEFLPYTSGLGIHMGHVRNYSIGDAFARFKRMNGFNILYPMGFDAFGLPAENAAIKEKIHPKEYTENSIKIIKKQMKELGLSYDWDRLVITCYPEYYKWNQYFFLKFYEKGLAYRKKAPVNWCSKCKSVLANEQVVNKKCWRHEDTNVEVKQLEQWFFRITNYADELLRDIKKLDWPERIKLMQENWIGRSEGVIINFKIKNSNEIIPVFTTRPDTIFGVTFLVLAPEHPKVLALIKGNKDEKKIKDFINKVVIEERNTRTDEKIKEGIFINKYAVNPLNNEEVPIYIANFALLEYGTGAIMAVPAHDQRDFEFAKKYKIPVKIVIQPKDEKLDANKITEAFIGEGILVNSKEFNNLDSNKAIEEIIKYIEKKKYGKRTKQYRLRDWLISRQRYWGTPIPVVYCDKCGMQSLKEKDLPIILPLDIKFGEGNPLETSKKFLEVKCPKCNGKARRETDTMDTFVDSSWYFLRYCDNKNDKKPFDIKKVKYWMPIDQYIGGAEHAVMHLLYARFFIKVLRDMKILNIDEPFLKLLNQGTLTKDGAKMSKSKGNIVSQDEIAPKYGIDAARLFLLFAASPDSDMEWSNTGIEAVNKFLLKLYSLIEKDFGKTDKYLDNRLNKTVKEVTQDIEDFKFNLAIIKIMDYTNYLKERDTITKESLEVLIKLVSIFTPHIAEEMWEKIGNKDFISISSWPKFDKNKINEDIDKEEKMIDNIRKDIITVLKLVNIKPSKIYLYCIPKEKEILNKSKISDFETIIYAVNDKDIYDPQGKAKKAKLGKPAIFIE